MNANRPNLLFIMTDHQRADSIGMVQCGSEVTPNLNRLAAGATQFTRAYNTCPLCVPARTALATGKYPTATGVVVNDWRGTSAGDHATIHECLAKAGYRVGHIGVHHIRVAPALEERVPFANWIGQRDYREHMARLGLSTEPAEGREAFRQEVSELQEGGIVRQRYSNTRTATWPHPAGHFLDNYYCDRAIDFLRDAPEDAPFALFLYLWAPHPPLVVPEPYASRFPPAELDLPGNVGIPAEGEPPNRRDGMPAQLAAGLAMDQWRKVWAAHLGLVNLADAGIARVLEALRKRGDSDHTVTVFTADHGDHLGQHGMYQKMEMYEQAVHVPLLIRVPGSIPGVCDVPVSHLDLMPTVLDLLGIGIPRGLDGIVLTPTLREGTPPPERPLFCQYSGNPKVGHCRRAVITRKYKYIHDPATTPELYDLEKDPLETRNLASLPEYADTLRHLHEQGREWAAKHADWVEF